MKQAQTLSEIRAKFAIPDTVTKIHICFKASFGTSQMSHFVPNLPNVPICPIILNSQLNLSFPATPTIIFFAIKKMDILLQFILYYSKFLPMPVREKLFIQPAATQWPAYAELQSEIFALPETGCIPELQNFIFSFNEKFLSDTIKDAKGFLLFIEYGEITSFTPIAQHGIRQRIGITVAHEFNIANNDSINETLLMNHAYNILIKILTTMYTDQKNSEYCPVNSLIEFPSKIYPVNSQYFFDHAGWLTIFERVNTLIF